MGRCLTSLTILLEDERPEKVSRFFLPLLVATIGCDKKLGAAHTTCLSLFHLH